MATQTHEPYTEQAKHSFLRTLGKKAHPLVAFWNKFNNDWTWNNAAGLAFSLMMAVFPIIITLLSLLGLFLNSLDPWAYQSFINSITNVSSSLEGAKPLVTAALHQVKKEAGLLGIIAIVLSLFNGSRLFLFMEGSLDIIYHVKPRGILAQNLMAFIMVLLFVIIFPIAVVASTAPTFVFSLLQKTALSQLPGSSFFFGLGGILGALIAWYILFQVIYIVVPHQKISFRDSWPGAVVAAVLLEIYLFLFPLFVSHFLGIYAGTLGLLILLIFFYYFALILFLGAEVNSFVAERVHETPQDLASMVHTVTSHLPTSEEAVQEQASATHKGEVPKEIRPKRRQSIDAIENAVSTSPSVETMGQLQTGEAHVDSEERQVEEQKRFLQGSRRRSRVEVVIGAALAFLVEFVLLHRRK